MNAEHAHLLKIKSNKICTIIWASDIIYRDVGDNDDINDDGVVDDDISDDDVSKLSLKLNRHTYPEGAIILSHISSFLLPINK